MTRIPGQSSETSVPSTQCTDWPTCLPDCTRDHGQIGEEMRSLINNFFRVDHETAIDEARERVLAERRRIMGEDMASRYGPRRHIIPLHEPFLARVRRSPRPTPASPFIPRRVPQTLIASALGQRRNAISLGRLPPHRVERLLSGSSFGRISGRSFGHISGRSSGQFTRRSPPSSSSYTLSSDMPDIGRLNMNDEGQSSQRAPRRSNRRDTPPQVTGDQLAQETDRVWESDIPRQSVPRNFPDGRVMTNLTTENFAGMSLSESEEEISSDGVSTAAENGSEVDELEFRLRFSLMDGVEHTGKNLPKKD
ncbi:hypothetical protein FAVG1_10085 [Fusarium avenaceum]|nr:hypothetical protein FAVG1_10085 [Fusarium avenaceum]